MHGADIFTYIFSFFTSRYHGANRIFILISKREILFHTHGHDQPESSAIFRSINNTSAHAGIMIRFTDVFAKQFHAPGQQRVKTRIEAFIPLHPIAEQILALYNRTDDTQPVFPLGSRDGIWHDIHQLGIIVGIRENLSYHQSRHSFGTLAISAGLSIESIAKMMGHANISTTQGYAQITEQKISEDMDRLIRRRARRQGESQSKM